MKKIWRPLVFITLLTLILVGVLSRGIRIDNISFSGIKIAGLYIKLDKKLFLEIDNIKIDKSTSDNSTLFDIDSILDMLPPIHSLFNAIEIRKLEYRNETARVIYKDENFYVDSDKLSLKTKIYIGKKGILTLNIERILIKNFDVDISGNLTANIKRDEYNFVGLFRVFSIEGKLKFDVKNDILSYHISSNEFSSPKTFMDNLQSRIDLNDTVAHWIYGYIKAASYKILSLSGKVDISTLNFYPKLINAQVVAKDVNITFHENVPNAKVENVRVNIMDNKIIFITDNSSYEGKKVDANVTIYNLIEGASGIRIDLYTNEYFDNSINKILKGFLDIEIPLHQTGGNSSSNLSIDVKFANIDVNVVGKFVLDNANISIANVSMVSPHTTIDLNNSILDFKNTRLKYDDLFDIEANGTLNASEKHMEAESFIHSLSITAKDNTILSIGNISTPFALDIINGSVNFNFRDFDTNMSFGEKHVINLGSLSKLYPYSSIMQRYDLQDGNISLRTTNFNRINGRAHIENLNLPLLSNNKKINSFDGTFSITKNGFYLSSLDKNIVVRVNEIVNVMLNQTDILLDTNSSLLKDNSSSMPINLQSLDGNIRVLPTNITLLSENLTVKLDENNSLSAKIAYKKGLVEFAKDNNSLNLYAVDMGSEFMNNITNKDLFRDGTFSATISGLSEDEFSGIIAIRGTKMRDFAFLNNIISFLNTIPALATLSDPGFRSEGFPVKSGVVEFEKIGDLIYVKNLFLDGLSSDISGTGYISLDNNEIYLNLKISTIKALGSIIDMIPLVNFIILGEDGSIGVNISVRGTLDDPKIETHILEDTLMSPINIIKRVLQLPFHIFRH